MRAGMICLALPVVLLASSACAADAQNPSGCADYMTNKTGGDPACDAAISAEQDSTAKSVMLFRRAYMEDAGGDFKLYPKALADLSEAIGLWPKNASALHERGYLYNELGRWQDALKDLDAQIALMPTDPRGYEERALSRFGLGDLEGVLEDRNTEVLLAPADGSNLIGRAWAQAWLGRYDAAGRDIESAADLAKKAGDGDATRRAEISKSDLAREMTSDPPVEAAKICATARTSGDFLRSAFIGDCTRAFLDGKTPSQRADALTKRSMAMPVVMNDAAAGLDDLRLAYALEPDKADRQFNLGNRLEGVGRHEEALRYLDMAISNMSAGKRTTAWALAARAQAKLAQGDIGGAFADGKKSFELEPNAMALEVTGDAVYAKTKSLDEAKVNWIGAWRLGLHDDELSDKLKKAGVAVPSPDDAPPAKKGP